MSLKKMSLSWPDSSTVLPHVFGVYSTSLFVSLARTCCEMVHTSPSLQNDSSPSSLLLLPVLFIFTLPFVLFCSYMHLIRVTRHPCLPRTVPVSLGVLTVHLKNVNMSWFHLFNLLKLCVFSVFLNRMSL